MGAHQIGVISDTHDLLRPEVTEVLRGCEAIIHGGDISSEGILEQLRQIAPVHAVRGNNDKEWAENLPARLCVTVCGVRFFVTHKKKDLPQDPSDTDIAVYGHSHRYEETKKSGTVFLNPGSCGPRRFHQPITMAVVTVTDDGFTVGKIDIPHPEAPQETSVRDEELLREDPRKLVEQIVAEVDRGRSIARISQKLRISEELAETVSRMYLTHTDITTDGILQRMGL